MRKSILGLSALSLFAIATPALAEDEATPEWKVTGSATLVSDYRFRGFTQSSENAAVQGSINLNHESGFYVGTWASSISFAGSSEIDLYAGYTTEVASGVTVDVGLLYYLYPKHGGVDTDFFEPYVNVSGALGPLNWKMGVNYAWSQSALGDNSAIYFHSEPSVAIPGTPITLNGHVGYAVSDGFPGGLGADHHVWDFSVGASAAWRNLTLGVNYVNTDEKRSNAEIAGSDGAIVFSLGASF
jgi:uncharacterized protein (TIGR02001 family)